MTCPVKTTVYSMAESRELELAVETRDGADACENAGSSVEAQQGRHHMDQPGGTGKKKAVFGKIRRRIRDPFNKKKIKELKRTKDFLEAAVKGLHRKLFTMISAYTRGDNIIGSVGNLQIDCTNNIHEEPVGDFGEIQEGIDKLTDAANRLLEELTVENERRIKENAELKSCQERSETKLDELKDLVLQCSSGISQQDIIHVQALKDLKDLQEALVTNMPDEQLVSDGISAIRLGLVFDHEYDFLPFKTKLLVTRVLHLFGHSGLVSLCETLRMDIPEDAVEFGCKEYSMTSGICSELLLNKDTCARILVGWVNKSLDNDSSVLLEVIQTHERERYEQIKQHMTTVHCSSEDKSAQTISQEKEITQYRSLSNLLNESNDNSSSDRSLSIDDNYFNYSSLERETLQLLKLISVEGITAAV